MMEKETINQPNSFLNEEESEKENIQLDDIELSFQEKLSNARELIKKLESDITKKDETLSINRKSYDDMRKTYIKEHDELVELKKKLENGYICLFQESLDVANEIIKKAKGDVHPIGELAEYLQTYYDFHNTMR